MSKTKLLSFCYWFDREHQVKQLQTDKTDFPALSYTSASEIPIPSLFIYLRSEKGTLSNASPY